MLGTVLFILDAFRAEPPPLSLDAGVARIPDRCRSTAPTATTLAFSIRMTAAHSTALPALELPLR